VSCVRGDADGVCADAAEFTVRTAKITTAARNASADRVARIKGFLPKWSASFRARRDRSRSDSRCLPDRSHSWAVYGTANSRTTFATERIRRWMRRGQASCPCVLRSPREKDVSDVTHEDGHAAHSLAGRFWIRTSPVRRASGPIGSSSQSPSEFASSHRPGAPLESITQHCRQKGHVS
jgi:hypothetical protein